MPPINRFELKELSIFSWQSHENKKRIYKSEIATEFRKIASRLSMTSPKIPGNDVR